MFASLFDNLTAIVIGTVLITTMLTLQMRQRIERVDETIHHSIREHVQETMNTLAEDVQNAMSENAAGRAFALQSATANDGENVAFQTAARAPSTGNAPDFLFGVDTLSTGEMTEWFAFPTRLENPAVQNYTASGDSIMAAQVVYRLVPNLVTTPSGPDTLRVSVQGDSLNTFRLERAVTFSPHGTDLPSSDFEPVSAGVFVDFDVEIVSLNSTTGTRAGKAPMGARAIRISLYGALPHGTGRLSNEQRNMRAMNAVRLSTTFRPKDL